MSCSSKGTPGDDYGSIACTYNCRIEGNTLCDLNGMLPISLYFDGEFVFNDNFDVTKRRNGH